MADETDGIKPGALVRYLAKEPPSGRLGPTRGELVRVCQMSKSGDKAQIRSADGFAYVPVRDLELVTSAIQMGGPAAPVKMGEAELEARRADAKRSKTPVKPLDQPFVYPAHRKAKETVKAEKPASEPPEATDSLETNQDGDSGQVHEKAEKRAAKRTTEPHSGIPNGFAPWLANIPTMDKVTEALGATLGDQVAFAFEKDGKTCYQRGVVTMVGVDGSGSPVAHISYAKNGKVAVRGAGSFARQMPKAEAMARLSAAIAKLGGEARAEIEAALMAFEAAS